MIKTLDEAIAHAREVAKNKRKMSEELWKYNDKYGVNEKQKERCISCAEEHEQLAEWLEKLKWYEEKPDGYLANECELAGYNKAIDDLLGGMNQITYNYQNADELFEKICDLAEQLKARLKDE